MLLHVTHRVLEGIQDPRDLMIIHRMIILNWLLAGSDSMMVLACLRIVRGKGWSCFNVLLLARYTRLRYKATNLFFYLFLSQQQQLQIYLATLSSVLFPLRQSDIFPQPG